MICSAAFDRYLLLDKNERVPLAVTIHLLFCPVCRTAVRQMSNAETLLAGTLSVTSHDTMPTHDPVVLSAMDKIAAAGLSYPVLEHVAKRVSMLRWFLVGVILASGFAFLPFATTGGWLQSEFGNALVIPFYILCGCAVTAYGGLFIGTNIDLFLKRFRTLKTGF